MGANVTNIGENAFNAVSGDVFILKPAQNFDINNFSSMANVYACDSLICRQPARLRDSL